MLRALRFRTIRRFPLERPETVGVRVDKLAQDGRPAEIGIPLIERARLVPRCLADMGTGTSGDSVAHRAELHPHDLAGFGAQLDTAAFPGDTYPPSKQAESVFVPLTRVPEIISVFTSIRQPGQLGKAYNEVRDIVVQRKFTLPGPEPMCEHGLRRSTCDLCTRRLERSRSERASKRVPTVDLFEFLLPYLWPPIEQNSDHPLVFPPNKRPYGYQYDGIEFLCKHKSALLADEMGLGKTIQALVSLRVLYRQGKARRTLVLCPRSVLSTWEREAREWAPELRVRRVRGTPALRRMLWQQRAHVFLTTYATLRQDIDGGVPLEDRFDVAILDEIQKIKNPEAKQTKSVRRINAAYRWGLSGTPLENRIDDVVAVFGYLDPSAFTAHHTYSAGQVKQRISEHVKRRRARDVLDDLPEKVSHDIWLELTDEQRRTYDQVESEGRSRLSQPDATRMHVFGLISDLKQICNLDPDTGKSCKLDYLIDHLESITESGHKALVCSQFPQKTLATVQSELSGFGAALFDGRLSEAQRDTLINQFQNAERPTVLLLSVKAGGLGIDLTRANYVFHYDHWWNPATAHQAEARAHRKGQEDTVFVHHLYTIDTIEERVYQLLADKQHLFNEVIDDLSEEHVQTTVTDEDLFALFGLEPPQQAQRAAGGPQSDLATLGAAEFEQLVAELFQAMGYKAQCTPHSRDGGVDVIAQKPALVSQGEYLVIQCKHHPESAVGAPTVQQLIGALADHRKATGAVLVTSGSFTRDARNLAQKHNVRLIDGTELKGLLRSSGVTR